MVYTKAERVHLVIIGWLNKMKKEGRFTGNVIEIGDGIFNLLVLEGLVKDVKVI